ncbi:MAG: hypothetical protein B7Z14_14960 [Bosea sp. 32-68-6]|nr:MAG: hypothetical protein B7Z14_14960 [Bosea sp. 32-68-6]
MERLADLTDRILQERQSGRTSRSNQAGTALVRAALCAFRAKADPAFKNRDFATICRAVFPGDGATLTFLKSASTPASTTIAGAGAELVGETVGEFLASLAPASAIAALLPAGINVDLSTWRQINLPFRSTAPTVRPWAAEGDAIAVTAANFAAVELTAEKIGVIAVASRELLRRSDAESIFGQMLRDDAAISLDAAYLSTSAASTGALAGLLYGVTPLTRVPILPSLAVPAGRVIAIDPVSLCHGYGANPDLITSGAATIHMDSEALAIRAGGVTAAPVRSLWQTDSMATRMLLDVGYGKRRANAVGFMENVEAW